MNSGINFGSMLINGRAVNLSDYDKNKDGKLQDDELKKLLEEFQLDTFNLKSIDKNGDKVVSPDELSVWAQQMIMEETLKQLITTRVSVELIGENAKYQQPIILALREFLHDFVENFSGNTSEMAEKFAEVLLTKYEELKKEIIPE